jgi:DNA-binding CsgD family transcriptional regulator/tetratricopeptide (TPR) repeat protein
VEVLLELGRAEHAAGEPTATARLEEAWRATDDDEIALELASMLGERTRWPEAATVARAALADVTDSRLGETQLHLFALLADVVRMDPSIGGDEPVRVQRVAARLEGSTPGERHVLAAAAVMRPVDTAEEHARAAELTQRTQADVNRFSDTGVVSSFIRAGRLEQAQEASEAALQQARRGGFVQRHATMVGLRGWIWLERGALPEARDDLESALAFASDVSLPPPVMTSNAAMLALALAEQGEPAHADDMLERHGVAGELPEHQVMNLILHFRSRVRALQGRRDEAVADALETGRRYERLGIRRAVPPWRSLAATLTGDEALAREELELARRWGTPLALGLAERGLGLVTQDEAALRRAVDLLKRSPNRLELARGQVELGAFLRRQGRRADARDPLRAGMDGAHACGAKPLAERARTELLATGARPRRLALQGAEALTPSERRVTELAANGLTNRQIAQELFVTTATVETHLRHTFRKLDVTSRGQLGAALRSRPA